MESKDKKIREIIENANVFQETLENTLVKLNNEMI